MPRLVAQSPEFSGKSFDLSGKEISVGRVADNKIQVEHASVSGHHAVFRLDGLASTANASRNKSCGGTTSCGSATSSCSTIPSTSRPVSRCRILPSGSTSPSALRMAAPLISPTPRRSSRECAAHRPRSGRASSACSVFWLWAPWRISFGSYSFRRPRWPIPDGCRFRRAASAGPTCHVGATDPIAIPGGDRRRSPRAAGNRECR
jgi:hypothetical protein